MLSEPAASGGLHTMFPALARDVSPLVCAPGAACPLVYHQQMQTARPLSRLPVWARTCAALPRGMKLDVGDALAVHVVLDDRGPLRPQVEQRHQAAGRAHRHTQPGIVEPHRRQRLAGLRSKVVLCHEQHKNTEGSRMTTSEAAGACHLAHVAERDQHRVVSGTDTHV
jgi:hypothetical protein